MKLFKKFKDILFDEEEVIAAPPVNETIKKVDETIKHEVKSIEEPEPAKEVIHERDLYKSENTFPFPEFDEDEFENNLIPNQNRTKVNRQSPSVSNKPTNIMEYERSKKPSPKPEYNRYEKIEVIETKDRRKFRPSPIISPVFGVLNEDYIPEEIKSKREYNDNNLDVDSVRRKAFGELDTKVDDNKKIDENTSVTTKITRIYEEKETVQNIIPEEEKIEKVRTIDELLEDTSDMQINIEEELERTEPIRVPEIEEKLKPKREAIIDDFEDTDTLESDLFDLIDSMYESKEEGE